jgi:hypothetical protein
LQDLERLLGGLYSRAEDLQPVIIPNEPSQLGKLVKQMKRISVEFAAAVMPVTFKIV